MSGVIDLSKLPAPNIIEPLDFQTIFDEMINDLKARLDEFDALVESEPIWKLLEVAAYRELMLRARINDACQSVMLAYAQGSNLDQIAALFSVVRQQIDPGNSNAIPPVDPSFESDARLRQRIQLSLEGHSSAGAIGSYRFHALGASVEVKDVDVASFEPGRVVVTVLSTQGNGEPSDALITLVTSKLNAKDVRPLTDWVEVKKAQIVDYQVKATLLLEEGPDAELIHQTSLQKVQNFVQQCHLLGRTIPRSGLYAALHQEGVAQVVLEQPSSDILVASHQAPWCCDVTVELGDRNG